MFTSLSTWLLRPYISYQYGKSGIKKLYKYNRIKRRKKSKGSKLFDRMSTTKEKPEPDKFNPELLGDGNVDGNQDEDRDKDSLRQDTNINGSRAY